METFLTNVSLFQVSVEEYLDVKKALEVSQSTVRDLMYSNQDLKHEIILLKNMYRQDSVSTRSIYLIFGKIRRERAENDFRKEKPDLIFH